MSAGVQVVTIIIYSSAAYLSVVAFDTFAEGDISAQLNNFEVCLS